MHIMVTYSDFLRLFNIQTPNDFAPGLELREEGIFVQSPSSLPDIVRGGEEEAVLTEHPGNLSEPVLKFPFELENLEAFMERFGLVGALDPWRLLKYAERKAWELAQSEAREAGNYHWPIVAGVYGLREKLQLQHDAERNDSKKIVLREVLDEVEALFERSSAAASEAPANAWPWGAYETELLHKLAAAVARYWVRYDPKDPSTGPLSKEVTAWLIEQGVAERVAEIMAQIIRADGLRTGPRK